MSQMNETVIAILSTSAVTGAVIELVRLFGNWLSKRKDTGITKLEREIRELNAIVQDLKKNIHDLDESYKVILHDRLWSAYNTLKNAKSISLEARGNLDYLFEEYVHRNGNHKGELIYNLMKKIPVDDEPKE